MQRFRPTLTTSVITIIVVPILCGLGFWQLDRADQKRQLLAAYTASSQKRPTEISAALAADTETFEWLPVKGRGIYNGPNILLDNRIHNTVVGYEILTPLTTGGVSVLVNRGWVAAPPTRDQLPALFIPSGEQSFSGRLGPKPTTGIAINEYSELLEWLREDVVRIQSLNFETLSAVVKQPLFGGVIYLDAESPGGFHRDWPTPGYNPQKHEAYATQWFSMAAIVFALYIGLNFRSTAKLSKDDPDIIK